MAARLPAKIFLQLSILFILSTTLGACAAPATIIHTVEVTRQVPQILVATVIIKETVLVTLEPAILSNATLTATLSVQSPVATPTPSATSQPIIAFPNARINGFGFRTDGSFFITVDTGQSLSGVYRAQVGKKNFSCDLVPKYPERLYCYGHLSQFGRIQTLRIYTDDEKQQTIFETEFMAPLKPTTTPTETLTSTPTP